MIVENFLSRLEKVKRTGKGSWLACCPAHGDKNPSMTIAEGDDGRVLVKCFAGCSIDEITGVLGMQISELFPPKAIDHHVPPQAMPFNARDVLASVLHEAAVVVVVAHDMAEGKPLTPEAHKRLLLAAQRLTTAAEVARV